MKTKPHTKQCTERNDNNPYKESCTCQDKTHTPTQHKTLDLVCIVQKHHDSDKVLEGRKLFDEAEAFIVKAVNSHKALVEALKELTEFVYEHDLLTDTNKMLNKAKQALSMAEGKE